MIINKDGLNERRDYAVNKPEGTLRFMALGDSFTFGLNVNTEDNWTERLEDMLNYRGLCPNISKYEVINLGVSGFDAPYIVKRFKDLGVKYHLTLFCQDK